MAPEDYKHQRVVDAVEEASEAQQSARERAAVLIEDETEFVVHVVDRRGGQSHERTSIETKSCHTPFSLFTETDQQSPLRQGAWTLP